MRQDLGLLLGAFREAVFDDTGDARMQFLAPAAQ